MTVAAEAKTRTLHVSYKARNGRRMTKDFAITEFEATDVAARAAAISNASAYGFGREWNLVNWKVLDAA
jgi:hypothetical protein